MVDLVQVSVHSVLPLSWDAEVQWVQDVFSPEGHCLEFLMFRGSGCWHCAAELKMLLLLETMDHMLVNRAKCLTEITTDNRGPQVYLFFPLKVLWNGCALKLKCLFPLLIPPCSPYSPSHGEHQGGSREILRCMFGSVFTLISTLQVYENSKSPVWGTKSPNISVKVCTQDFIDVYISRKVKG